MVFSRWRRYGYACVNFGTPLSARAYCQEQGLRFHSLPRAERFPQVERLCRRIMTAIADVVPVLPVSMVSRVFRESMDKEMTVLDIERRINRLQSDLAARGAPVFEVHRSTRARVISEALHMLLLRGMVTETNGVYRAVPEEIALIDYYANAIVQWWDLPAHQDRAEPVPEQAP